MAIAYDNSAQGGTVSSSTLTFSHTCAGSNRILFVGIEGDGSSDTLTSVTYAGVSMTRINAVTAATTGNRYLYLYYLVAPATGANNVVATVSSGSVVLGVSASYTGASQTGVPDSSNTGGSSSGTSRSVSTTTVANNCWVVGHFNGAATPTAAAGTTLRATETTYGFSTIGDSNGVVSPAGSKSLGITWSGSNGNGGCVASFKPATSTTNTSLSVTATAVLSLTKSLVTLKTLAVTSLAVISLAKANIFRKTFALTSTAVLSLSKVWTHLISLAVGSGTPTVRASYSETNEDGYVSFNTGANVVGVGQSFLTGTVDEPLDSVKFYMKKTGSPTGNGYAKLYAHSGTFGTNSIPTGTALATSDPFDVSTLSTSPALITFNFTGANRATISSSTYYVVTFETTAGAPSNTPMIAIDSTPGYAGNYSEKAPSTWTGYSTQDVCFYVYTAPQGASASVALSKTLTAVRTLSVTSLAVLALSKVTTALKSLTVTATSVLSLLNPKLVMRDLAVTASAAIDMLLDNLILKALEVTASASVTLSKIASYFKTLAITASSVISLVKGLSTSMALAVTATVVPGISKLAAFYRTLAVTATGVIRRLINGSSTVWSNITKHASTWTHSSKSAASTWTKPDKSSSSWTNSSKSSSATWTKVNKSTDSNWTNTDKS